MPIAKFTTNLYASEVYRELERNAVKKGFFKPTEEQQIKQASQQITQTKKINEKVDVKPSGDFVQDVAKLAYALRRKGFIRQADEIENKLITYKQAENELYNIEIEKCKNDHTKEVDIIPGDDLSTIETRETAAKKILDVIKDEPHIKQASSLYVVTRETNNDFLNFAHRDGDVDIVGWGELGVFETLQSVADKILAVAKKPPTGSMPIDKIASLVKSAQDASTGYTETIKTSLKELSDIIKTVDQCNFTDFQNAKQSSLFIALLKNEGGAEKYQKIDNYNRMYKNAFKGIFPKSQSEMSQIIYNNLSSNPADAQHYLSSIGNSYKWASLNSFFTKEAQFYNPMNEQLMEVVKQNASFTKEQSEKAKLIADKIAGDISILDQQQQKIIDEGVAKLNLHKINAINYAAKIEQLISTPTTSPEQIYDFASYIVGQLDNIKKSVWWTKTILNAFDKQGSSQIDSLLSLIERNAQEIVKNINPKVVVNKLEKLNNDLRSAIKSGKTQFRSTLDALSKLYSLVNENKTDEIKALGYNSISDILPDIANVYNQISNS